MLFSPLEQFQISIFYPFVYYGLDLSLTNFSFASIAITFLLVSFSVVFVRSSRIWYVSQLQAFTESIYRFVHGIMAQQAGKAGFPYLPWAFSLFVIIFISNFLGLFAIGFTLTAQLAVTVGLAFSLNCGFLFLAFYLHGFNFLLFFVPSGIPVFLVPFMIVIELFSYSIRSISLSVRLFANMMAGHTLLHIICSFFLTLFWSYNVYASLVPLSLLVAIFFLEIAISFLQAYVFLTLFCIYLNDSLSPSH